MTFDSGLPVYISIPRFLADQSSPLLLVESGSQVFNETLSESLGVSESLGAIATIEGALAESLGATESLGVENVIGVDLSESLGVSESLGGCCNDEWRALGKPRGNRVARCGGNNGGWALGKPRGLRILGGGRTSSTRRYRSRLVSLRFLAIPCWVQRGRKASAVVDFSQAWGRSWSEPERKSLTQKKQSLIPAAINKAAHFLSASPHPFAKLIGSIGVFPAVDFLAQVDACNLPAPRLNVKLTSASNWPCVSGALIRRITARSAITTSSASKSTASGSVSTLPGGKRLFFG